MIQYQTFELTFMGEAYPGSQTMVDLSAVFTCQNCIKTVSGFYAGDGRYVIRYFPQNTGLVTWKISGIFSGEGQEECVSCPDGIHHGLVKPNRTALMYEDGTPCRPFGTTVYALMHQPKERIRETIRTIIDSPFDKVRACLFPKHYSFNEEEPPVYPFKQNTEGRFDFHRPCFAFWDAFEETIKTLEEHQVQLDLILFHPYDSWGFSNLTREEYRSYLHYLIARFCAFPNVWWSLANEYDCMKAFSMDDWDCIENEIARQDVYGHMMSCHHMLKPYDFSRPDITHCSIQGDPTSVEDFMNRFHKPVLIDECGYEGNILYHWGHLSGFEMVNRIWLCCVMGGYGTHGETFMDPNDVLWWGKGGKLHGESPERIRFLKTILNELPGPLTPVPSSFLSVEKFKKMKKGFYQEDMNDFARAIIDLPLEEAERIIQSLTKETRFYTGHYKDEVFLTYYGRHCTSIGPVDLPPEGSYQIEVLDAWEMTRETVLTGVNGHVDVSLPGREGIAVLALKM